MKSSGWIFPSCKQKQRLFHIEFLRQYKGGNELCYIGEEIFLIDSALLQGKLGSTFLCYIL